MYPIRTSLIRIIKVICIGTRSNVDTPSMSNAIYIFVFLIILSTNEYPYCYHLSKPDLSQRYEGSNAECIVPLTFTTANKN